MPQQPHFDIERWKELFPWDEVCAIYQTNEPELHNITSPVDIVVMEERRKKVVQQFNEANSKPVDIFTFGIGKPDDPTSTKVGGVPYRSMSKPWPKDGDHEFDFLAQFNFEDSRDLIGETPSDVLLVFVSGEDYSDFYFEWADNDVSDLITAEKTPEPSFKFVNCYGLRHRTIDYPKAWLPNAFGFDILEATKIGGIPNFGGVALGWNEETNEPKEMVEDLSKLVDGRYLCTLSAIQANPNFEYPFANMPASLTLSRYNEPENTLILVDMGSLFLFLADDGSINHYFQSS